MQMSTIKKSEGKEAIKVSSGIAAMFMEKIQPLVAKVSLKGKQRQHMNERRTVTQTLAQLNGPVKEDDFASDVELKAKVAVEVSRQVRIQEITRLARSARFLERRKKRKQSAALRKAGANKQP